MEGKKSNSNKKCVEGLCLIIKHPGSWSKFCKEIEKYNRLTQVRAIGDLNLKNSSQGRDSFYQAEATKEIGFSPLENFINTDTKEKLDRFFQDWFAEDIFEEVRTGSNNEYRLRFFVAIGPSAKIFFFSDSDKNLEYLANLATRRGLSIETNKCVSELSKK